MTVYVDQIYNNLLTYETFWKTENSCLRPDTNMKNGKKEDMLINVSFQIIIKTTCEQRISEIFI